MFGLKQFFPILFSQTRRISYKQGQTSPGGVREYFYYIDHQGQVISPHSELLPLEATFGYSFF